MHWPAQSFLTSTLGINVGAKADSATDDIAQKFAQLRSWFAETLPDVSPPSSSVLETYLPAPGFFTSKIGIYTGGIVGPDHNVIDSIIRWFDEPFSQFRSSFVEAPPKLGSWFAESFPKLGSWFAETLPKLGPFVEMAYQKSSELLYKMFGILGPFRLAAEVYRWFPTSLVEFVQKANAPLEQHPYQSLFTSLLIFVGPWILLLPLFLMQVPFSLVLFLVGFGANGVIGGSLAASFQSAVYGAHTPAGSLFAILQSAGTYYNVGMASFWVLWVIRLIAGGVAAYVLFGIILR